MRARFQATEVPGRSRSSATVSPRQIGEDRGDARVSLLGTQAVVANRGRLGEDELKPPKCVFGERSLKVSKPVDDLFVEGRALGDRVELDDASPVEVLSFSERVPLNGAREMPPLAARRTPPRNRQHGSNVRRRRSAIPQVFGLRSQEALKTD
jgi:hypothetical protein